MGERVGFLFDVVATAVVDDGPRWRSHTSEDVGLLLFQRIGAPTPSAATAAIERLRAGQISTRSALDELALQTIAEFFGTGPGYFGDDPLVVGATQDQLLDTALRNCEVLSYRLCRAPTPSSSRRRDVLRRALGLLRPATTPPDDDGDDISSATLAKPAWDTRSQSSPRHGPTESLAPADGGEMSRSPSPRTNDQLHDLCYQLLRDLDILPPLTPEALCKKLGRARGRALKLLAGELNTTASVGHLIPGARRDVIAYQRSAPRQMQAHVIYHEVMHLVLGHLDGIGDGDTLTCGALDESTSYAEGETDTSPAGGLYARWQEWEAETGATILSELSRQRADPRLIGKDAPRAEQGIAAAFGLNSRGWR